jgi:hypothetical protein
MMARRRDDAGIPPSTESTSHDAVSEAQRSELAGVSSVREAGIPPSSESDKE